VSWPIEAVVNVSYGHNREVSATYSAPSIIAACLGGHVGKGAYCAQAKAFEIDGRWLVSQQILDSTLTCGLWNDPGLVWR
jgi:hypothetical protein